MHAFFLALGRLLLQSLHSTVGWMGTTLLAVGLGIVSQFVVPWVDGLIEEQKTPPKPFFKRIRGTAVVAVSAWILIYSANVVYTIYDHHQAVVRNNQALATRLASEDSELLHLKTSLQMDEDKLKAVVAPEPADSLRRRTIMVVDEWRAYLEKRAETRPTVAVPNFNDPNPSEETKKAIQKWQTYSRETAEYYAKHFRGRFLGIIREYESKGVPTHYLESNFGQFVPDLLPAGSAWEDSSMDFLGQFRDLAYRVDARDHLITF
jgi:hypothetical protein